MTDTAVLLQVDSRKRVYLGSMAKHDQYLLREEPGGVLIMEPALVLTSADAEFLSKPDLVEQLDRVNAHPERRRTRTRSAAPKETP